MRYRGNGAGAITSEHSVMHAVGIDQHSRFGVTLVGAFRDCRRDGLICELRWNAIRLQQPIGMGREGEQGSAGG